MKRIIIIVFMLAFTLQAFCQKEAKVIQFSGYALTGDSMMGVPMVHITILNRGRVAEAGPDGFFSFAAQENDTLYFTCYGYKPGMYIIPKNLKSDKFSMIQLMSRGLDLPQTVIYPWGDINNFHAYFLEVRPPKTDLERAQANLDRQRLAAIGETLERDGGEAGQQSLRMSSAKTYYYGQTPPQNIFNPLAWAEFIKAWKRGDFKKKDKPTAPETNQE